VRLANNKRGAGFIDVITVIFLVAVIGVVFATSFPTAITASRQAQEYKVATAIAQQKVEQLHAMNYESLTQPLMTYASAIDEGAGSSPYSFTTVDSVSSQLPSGTGQLSMADLSSSLKRVSVTVSWQSSNGRKNRSVTLTTYFADRRPRSG